MKWRPAGQEHPLGTAGRVFLISMRFTEHKCWIWGKNCAHWVRFIALGVLNFMVHVLQGVWVSPRGEISRKKFTNTRVFWVWTAFSRPSDDNLVFKRKPEEDGLEKEVSNASKIGPVGLDFPTKKPTDRRTDIHKILIYSWHIREKINAKPIKFTQG
jgi:hypothetical protein